MSKEFSKRVTEGQVLPISHVQHALVNFMADHLAFRVQFFDVTVILMCMQHPQCIPSLVLFVQNIPDCQKKNYV